MFFKNALTYRLTEDTDFSDIEEKLKNKLCHPCGIGQFSSYGFTVPYGGIDAPLTRQVNGYILVATKKEERILPASVIKKELDSKVGFIEQRDSRKVFKKEKDQLKDEIIASLLPQAFIKEQYTHAIINPMDGLIIVDASSSSKAEALLSLLREVLETLPIRPIAVKNPPALILTDWVRKQSAPRNFSLREECVLKDCHEQGGFISCKKQDLTTEEVRSHIYSGMQVTKLALDWFDKILFVLDEKLAIRNIKFTDMLLEQADRDGGEDVFSQFDASFLIMASELSNLVQDIAYQLGGEE